ncbi:hypothetical protein SEA_BEUFFERT_263 [Streptomyces phage Beuffert]|nr:hypothetical protein SEA_BEUFFERT_263 [Streptomyces phage Beuffert]
MFNPFREVSMWNRAIEAEYAFNGETLIRSAFFGTAKEFAEWLESFDYESGDVFGWTGDSATMRAVNSYRTDEYRETPVFITEYNTNDGSSEIIGVDQFHNLRRMFAKDRKNYRIHRHFCGDAKVYSVMYIGNGEAELSSYVWHVPFGADELPIS